MNLRAYARWVLPGLLAIAFLLSPVGAISKTKDGKDSAPAKSGDSEKKGDEPKIQRVPNNVYENLRNSVSNIDYYTTNYGIFGLNILGNSAGGLWPRGQSTAYIFGGGIWFGSFKVARDSAGTVIRTNEGTDSLRKMAVISYNPNSGASWMVPGRVGSDIKNSAVDNTANGINKYRIYYSTDYSKQDGKPLDARDVAQNGPSWPIWDTRAEDSLKVNRYFGEYVDELGERNLERYPKGPAIISGEDVFTTYKDTDLNKYEIARKLAQQQGYPIGIQVEQTDYSWGFGDYANFMFMKYLIINKSPDTLWNCWMAPAMDMDIGQAGNDRTKIAIADKFNDSLNLAVQWSETEPQRYGYIGFDFLESPAVDSINFVRKDKRVYTGNEQIGLKTFRNWTIQNDPKTPEERYDFMSDLSRDGDTGPGDKRFLMATGPFNLRPGDTARIVVGMMFAYGTKGGVADGTWQDMGELVRLDTFAQKVYNENFLTPVPPEQPKVSWSPLNNGIKLTWDDRAERSLDFQERGLDFQGYVIQRRRQGSPLATVPRDTLSGWNLNWKTVAGFRLPAFPDSAVRLTAARRNDPSLLGSWSRLPMLMDTVSTGTPATIYRYYKYCYDTLHRPARLGVPARPDTVIRTLCDSAYGVRNVQFAFDPFDDRNTGTRDMVRDVITAIMDSVTNGHTFIDVGDDNRDGKITENTVDLSQNEKLINNVYYYYQVLAFDEGSYGENTPPKLNTGIDGINRVRTTPEAPATGYPVTTELVSSNGLGGIYNPRLAIIDENRLGQVFGGDTLEFEFQPTDLGTTGFQNLVYSNQVIVRRRSNGEEITRFFINYNGEVSDRADSLRVIESSTETNLVATPLDSGYVTYWRGPDSLDFHNARSIRSVINGSFIASPDLPTYNTTAIYKATFGLNFDYSFRQFGDSLRFGKFGDFQIPYQAPIDPFENTSSDVNLVARNQYVGQLYSSGSYNPQIYRIPSIGQTRLEVQFLPGGTETITFNKSNKDYTFNVEYLNMSIKNIATYKRAVINENGTADSVDVTYDYVFPADPKAQDKVDSNSNETNVQLARSIEPGTFGIYAYGWLNRPESYDERKNPLKRTGYRATTSGPLGTANRYYKSPASDAEGNLLYFTHRLMVNGAEILIDAAGMGSYDAKVNSIGDLPQNVPVDEFQAGDKFIVDFTGGALGLPQPGAKIAFAINKPEVPLIDSASGRDYTDNLLDEIQVVPNPYLINHLGQISTSDRMLYFTRLPEICTIEIYTAAGELLRTIEHQASIENGRVAVDAWDMLTKAGRQVQSQMLVARITTPNGAETIKKFSVVVGGFRIFSR